MAFFSYLLRRAMKDTKRKPGPSASIKRLPGPIRRIQAKTPVKKKDIETLSAPGWLSNILGATQPGAKKLQFPFEKIPPVTIDVSVNKDTQGTLLALGAIVAGGMVGAALLRRRN